MEKERTSASASMSIGKKLTAKDTFKYVNIIAHLHWSKQITLWMLYAQNCVNAIRTTLCYTHYIVSESVILLKSWNEQW